MKCLNRVVQRVTMYFVTEIIKCIRVPTLVQTFIRQLNKGVGIN